MSKWKSLELELPSEVQSAADFLSTVADTLVSYLEIIETLAKALSAFQIEFLNVQAAIIQAALDAIRKAVETLLEDSAVYYLAVPIRKQAVWDGQVIPAPLDIPFFGPFFDRIGDFAPISDSQQQQLADDPSYKKFLERAALTEGGNMGFYRTVAEATYDRQDPNRPQFDEDTDWVGGAVALVGATDLLSILNALVQLFKLFLKDKEKPPADDIAPVPTGLKAIPIAAPGDGNLSVRLDWDPLDAAFFNLPGFSAGIVVERVAIIRSTSPAATAASSVEDLFTTSELTEGLEEGDHKVIAEKEFNGITTSYLDFDQSLEKGRAYYYAVAYKAKYGNEGDNAVEIAKNGTAKPYEAMSNVVKLEYRDPPRVSAGPPPNWKKSATVADLLPPLALFVRQVLALLDQFQDTVEGATKVTSDYLEYLTEEVQRQTRRIERFTRQVQKLLDAFLTPDAGLYYRTFQGQGGTSFFISDLAQSLAGRTEGSDDPNAPPFNDGDEFVTGVILMTGGPSKAAVDKTLDVIDLLIGSGESQATNAVQQAISDISAGLNLREAQVLGDDFQPAEVVTPVATPFFDDALNPIPADQALESSPERQKCAGISEETGNVILGDNFAPQE